MTLAGHDHLAGLAGSGAQPDDVVNSVGTAETVMVGVDLVPDVDRALSLGVAVTVMPEGTRWALLASAARSGLVVEAVARALGRPADELDQAAVGAGRAPFGPALVDAAVGGEPLELPVGTPGTIWNGVLDALAARAWDAVDRLELAAGQATVRGDPGRRRAAAIWGGRPGAAALVPGPTGRCWCSAAGVAASRGSKPRPRPARRGGSGGRGQQRRWPKGLLCTPAWRPVGGPGRARPPAAARTPVTHLTAASMAVRYVPMVRTWSARATGFPSLARQSRGREKAITWKPIRPFARTTTNASSPRSG